MRRWRVAAVIGIGALALRLAAAFRQGEGGAAADYIALATGGRVLSEARRCLYCLEDQTRAQVLVLGYHPPPPAPSFPAPFVSPPPVALLLQPLAGLPLATALPVYLGLALALIVLSGAVLERVLRDAVADPVMRSSIVVLGVASLPGATAVLLGQIDPVALIFGALALLAIVDGRAVLAGALLSGMLVKPQTVWLVLAALIIGRHRRVLIGFASGAVAWSATSLGMIGPGGVLQWYRYVQDRLAGQAVFTRGPAGVANLLGGAAGAVFAAGVLLAVAMTVVMFLARTRLRDPLVAVGLGIAASLACSPHLFSDDMLLLALPFTVLARRSGVSAMVAGVAVNVAFLLDEYVMPPSLQRVEGLAVLMVVGLLATGWELRGWPNRSRLVPEPSLSLGFREGVQPRDQRPGR